MKTMILLLSILAVNSAQAAPKDNVHKLLERAGFSLPTDNISTPAAISVSDADQNESAIKTRACKAYYPDEATAQTEMDNALKHLHAKGYSILSSRVNILFLTRRRGYGCVIEYFRASGH